MDNAKRIDGLPYFVTETGEVYSERADKMMIGDVNNAGYRRVVLKVNGVSTRHFVHRLVAEQFVTNPDPVNKIQVNHIDGDKANNSAFNLEWVTRSENERHARSTGLKDNNKSGHSFRPVCAVSDDDTVIASYLSAGKAAAANNCTYNDIDNVCRRHPLDRKIAGHRWCFEDSLPSDNKA